MAQSSMRLAVELAIAGKVEIGTDLKELGNIAHRLMDMEVRLVDQHLERYKSLQQEGRRKDIDKAFAKAKTQEDISKVWNSLSEDEQVEYQAIFQKTLKKIA